MWMDPVGQDLGYGELCWRRETVTVTISLASLSFLGGNFLCCLPKGAQVLVLRVETEVVTELKGTGFLRWFLR